MSTVPNFSVENDRESLNNVNCESLQVSGDLTVGSDLTVGGTINPAFSPNGVSTAIPVAVGNTDISVVQPPNSILTSITVVNTGADFFTTNGVAGDDLDLTIGTTVGGAEIMPATALLNDLGGPVNWAAGIALPLFVGVVGARNGAANAFAPFPGAPSTTEALQMTVAPPPSLFSAAGRTLNFRFSVLANSLTSSSSVAVLCTFQGVN